MTSTFTTNKSLEKPAIGDPNWGGPLNSDFGIIDKALGSVPSMMSDRPERKAGGRVGGAHEDAADRLVNAAERAKKEISRGTESLLDTPDDHVAAALEIANRSI